MRRTKCGKKLPGNVKFCIRSGASIIGAIATIVILFNFIGNPDFSFYSKNDAVHETESVSEANMSEAGSETAKEDRNTETTEHKISNINAKKTKKLSKMDIDIDSVPVEGKAEKTEELCNDTVDEIASDDDGFGIEALKDALLSDYWYCEPVGASYAIKFKNDNTLYSVQTYFNDDETEPQNFNMTDEPDGSMEGTYKVYDDRIDIHINSDGEDVACTLKYMPVAEAEQYIEEVQETYNLDIGACSSVLDICKHEHYEGNILCAIYDETIDDSAREWPLVWTPFNTMASSLRKKAGIYELYDLVLSKIPLVYNITGSSYYDLYDIDGNGIQELIVETGTSDIDRKLQIYTMVKKDGQAYVRHIGEIMVDMAYAELYPCKEGGLYLCLMSIEGADCHKLELKDGKVNDIYREFVPLSEDGSENYPAYITQSELRIRKLFADYWESDGLKAEIGADISIWKWVSSIILNMTAEEKPDLDILPDDALQAYQEVLKEYQKLLPVNDYSDWPDNQSEIEGSFPHVDLDAVGFLYAHGSENADQIRLSVKYAMYDMDDNGIDEMLISLAVKNSDDDDYDRKPMIHTIYTFDGKDAKIAINFAGPDYVTVYSNGCICEQWKPGTAAEATYYYQLNENGYVIDKIDLYDPYALEDQTECQFEWQELEIDYDIQESEENTEESEKSTEESEAETELDAWKTAYIQLVETDIKNDSAGYQLIYIDDDDIPELFVYYGYNADGGEVYFYNKGEVNKVHSYDDGFSYIEREGLFCCGGGKMDRYFDIVYEIDNGQIVQLARGDYGAEDTGNLQVDEEGNIIYLYYWNGEEVSEEEYEQNMMELYDYEKARRPYDNLNNGQEIIELIEER